MVGQIYSTEVQLNQANSSDTEAPFLDLELSITNGIDSSKIYDKQDDFNFEIIIITLCLQTGDLSLRSVGVAGHMLLDLRLYGNCVRV